MNAKRFFHLSVGVLCLTLAFAVGRMTAEGPTPVAASIIDPSACGIVGWDYDGHMIDENGTAWGANQYGWFTVEYQTPPVPVSQIKFWAHNIFLTVDNEYWHYFDHGTGWISYGVWPGGPSPAEKTTWSKLKSEFK